MWLYSRRLRHRRVAAFHECRLPPRQTHNEWTMIMKQTFLFGIAGIAATMLSGCLEPQVDSTSDSQEQSLSATSPLPLARQDGAYCYTLCSGTWYVNPRITVNCDSYGQSEVCPHRGLAWQGALWCIPTSGSCPPAVPL
jgi:hypothetical protein